MATMFPDSVHSFSTDGEERTYAFFRDAARPDAQHLCWYTPDIQDQEPDFLLFDRNVRFVHSAKGLDWAAVFLLGLDALDLGKKGILARSLVYL
ncbi:MAG TPA: hypothetical protein ENN39_01455 [Desulfonatronum sp.]|nr:hypothetical protein [Desulfonatronum sp.]